MRRANVGTGERSASERGIEWIHEASTRKRPLEVVVEVAAAVRIFDIARSTTFIGSSSVTIGLHI